MKKILLIITSLILISCNNPEGKVLMNSEEFGIGGYILLTLAILVIPVSVYFMKYHNKKKK